MNGWWSYFLSWASWTEHAVLVAVPHGATLCRRIKQPHKGTELFRELWDFTSMTILERETRILFTLHSSEENPGQSFHNFQSDLTVNFWGRLGWVYAEHKSISQHLLERTWTSYLLPLHRFLCCQGEMQVFHFTEVLYLASELLGTSVGVLFISLI